MGEAGPRPDAAASPALTPELPDGPGRGHLPGRAALGLRKTSRGHPEGTFPRELGGELSCQLTMVASRCRTVLQQDWFESLNSEKNEIVK